MGCFPDIRPQHAHDAQCVTYRGPDGVYVGKEICVVWITGAPEDRSVRIYHVDTTAQDAYKLVGRIDYKAFYPHQGCFSEDHRFLLYTDEADEAC